MVGILRFFCWKGENLLNGKIKVINRVMFAVSALILAASLVFYLFKWGTYPAEIGVHFDGGGNFDVTASKFYGFYPHIAGGIITAGLWFAVFLVGRKKTGMRITEKGEEHFKAELSLTLDCIALLVSLFFGNWSRCVALQIPLDLSFARLAALLIAVTAVIGVISQIMTCSIHRLKEKKTASSGVGHRLCRLIPWLLTAGSVAMLAETWGRYPSDDKLYGDPEYYGKVFFGNFDAYYDRAFLLIPQIMGIVLLTVLEMISVRAAKADKQPLVSLTDKLKLITGVFFMLWNFTLMTEQSIGPVSVGVFALLCAVSFVIYARKKKEK